MHVKYKTSCIDRFWRTYGAVHCHKLLSWHKAISICKPFLEFLGNISRLYGIYPVYKMAKISCRCKNISCKDILLKIPWKRCCWRCQTFSSSAEINLTYFETDLFLIFQKTSLKINTSKIPLVFSLWEEAGEN